MEMSLNNGFCEMSQEESIQISGGANGWVTAAVATAGVIGIACAPAAVGYLIVVKGATVAAAAATGLTMVGSGSIAIGSVGHAQ